MPVTFPETDEWVSQTAPAAGETRIVESVADPFRRAGKRAAALKARLDYIDPDKGGIRRIRTRSLPENVQILTEHAHGEILYVTGFGLYRYDAFDDGSYAPWPYKIKPDNVAPDGEGRWVSQYAEIASNIPFALARLDENQKLQTTHLPIYEGDELPLLDAELRIPAARVRNGQTHFESRSMGVDWTNAGSSDLQLVPLTKIVVSDAPSGAILTVTFEVTVIGDLAPPEISVRGRSALGDVTLCSRKRTLPAERSSALSITGSIEVASDNAVTWLQLAALESLAQPMAIKDGWYTMRVTMP
ncbi:MAG: hypothetical protein EOP08_13585 [Proteobacteria bacterium]|nr:MAG: hypothetical protein EOP08_13585 [Pseudomonadota bacterium]